MITQNTSAIQRDSGSSHEDIIFIWYSIIMVCLSTCTCMWNFVLSFLESGFTFIYLRIYYYLKWPACGGQFFICYCIRNRSSFFLPNVYQFCQWITLFILLHCLICWHIHLLFPSFRIRNKAKKSSFIT